MYADDLLLILSTCSDFRKMLRTVFSKPIPSHLIPQYFFIPVYRASLRGSSSEP